VGGAINLLSTPIPQALSGFANLEFGENSEQRQHFWYGGMQGQWGFLVETHQHETDGFHSIDRSARDTGFDKQDYMVKLRWQSADGAALPQRLDLKLNYAEEVSNASYLGVTDAQFKRDPYRRYGVTDLDRMDNRQKGAVLRHWVGFSDTLALTTTVYRNEFERAWYKLDRIAGQGLASVISDANNGVGSALAILEGTADVANIRIKDNARDYYGEGIQFELNGRFTTGELRHEWLAGARWHEDEADRFQIVDVFDQVNGSLVFQNRIQPGSSDNRIEEAEALSLWLEDRISAGDLELTLSLRREDVASAFTRYAALDRSAVASRGGNDTDEWLAGVGATYQLSEQWLLLAGVHQGFAPAGAGSTQGTGPEKSVNYEAGVRYRGVDHGFDAILFYSDFENTVTNCSFAFPCAGNVTSGTESQGESVIAGIELSADAVLWRGAAFAVPARLSYTYTDAEHTRDSDTSSVRDGDVLQYLPENVLSLRAGVEHGSGWTVYLEASYVDEMCIDTTCGRRGVNDRYLTTDAHWVVDLSASYPLNDSVDIYAKLDNLLDDESIVARSPAGARVNKPRTGYLGVRLAF
ncbi:MAG: TonB-dependent receptor, partial [Spongiibacteraceae bacterium]|jgi:Fe(3+) dicitrate transport protein|nr:TonB-dependent receptor [Spongiibacteraceae bacterium]